MNIKTKNCRGLDELFSLYLPFRNMDEDEQSSVAVFLEMSADLTQKLSDAK